MLLYNVIIIIVGSNLPHIAEYISIGSTKDEVINKHDYSLPVPPRGVLLLLFLYMLAMLYNILCRC